MYHFPLHFHTTVLGHFGTYLVEESTSLGTTKVGATTSTVIRPKLRALLIIKNTGESGKESSNTTT